MRTYTQKRKPTQQTTPPKSTTSAQARLAQNQAIEWVHHVQRPKSPTYVQAKLKTNSPRDRYEQEADRIAEQVMRMAEPQLQHARPGSAVFPKDQIEQPGREEASFQTKSLQSGTAEQSAALPILHSSGHASGQPLDPATRAAVESRFGHDFSNVRVHYDGQAASQAAALSARAFTIGADIHFGRAEYAPDTSSGLRLLSHELVHVLQQRQSTPAIQRQPLGGQQFSTIPTDLRSSAHVAGMSEADLTARHDRILAVLASGFISADDRVLLHDEVARIGIELARRRALADGRTFSEDAINKMKDYFVQNAQKPAKPEKNAPPPPPGGWQDSCIIALNKGMKIVTDKPALSTTPKSIEKTMEKIAASGHSNVAREIWFESKSGRVSKGGALRPEKPQTSIWDTVIALSGGDPGWSVFTMSLLDGNHSVTLTLDAKDTRAPRIYWSDQWQSKGGWKEYTRAELDAEVTRLVQGWWDKQAEGKKYATVVRLWRISATAATNSGP